MAHFRTICFFAAALVVAIAPPVASAADYFVATTGNNSNAGTATAPWRTLQHAADVVGPGDHVTVRPGNYAGFYLETSGTLATPIEFFAEPGVLINQDNGTTDDGINLEGASHIVIDGFRVAGMGRAGVRSVGFPDEFASHVTVRNVTAENNGVWGIFTGHVDDLLIEENFTSGSLDEHGIYVSNSGDRPIIQNNVIWNNHGSGIHMNGDLSQGGDGIISNALVSGNIIYNNGTTGSGINMDGVQNSLIQNNLVYNNHSSGISLYQIDAAEPADDNLVVNNTIHIADNGRWALNIQDGSTGTKAFNNILISEHEDRGAIDICSDCRPGFVSDYNVVISRFTAGGPFISLAQWRSQTGQDMHSIVADADELFADWANGIYELVATSPARDAGFAAAFAPTFDLDFNPRPIGPAYDVGAYEFNPDDLPGDFNHDGTVDAVDYTVWRDGLGTEFEPEDYDVWKSHFGQSTGGSSDATAAADLANGASGAVPEPSAIILFMLGSCWYLGIRHEGLVRCKSAAILLQ